jgi:hypothetical protein
MPLSKIWKKRLVFVIPAAESTTEDEAEGSLSCKLEDWKWILIFKLGGDQCQLKI